MLIALVPLRVLGQAGISDSLLFSFTLQSIETFGTNLKVFHQVMEPRYLLDHPEETLKGIGYFSEADIDLLDNQVRNPKILSWDNPLFKGESISIVNAPKDGECTYISVPLISEDESIVLIYYETWIKKKRDMWGEGTLTVWTKTSMNKWIQRRQQNLWGKSIEQH